MFYPLALCIGIRYLRAKKHNQFISFITMISVLGIALGVTVLVTVLSIMNGFDEAIRDKIFNIAHHITLHDIREHPTATEWPRLRKDLLKETHIKGIAPFLAAQGLLVKANASQPTALYGIVPSFESSVSFVKDRMVQGTFKLTPTQKSIILGEQIAFNLGVDIGDTVTVYLPILNKTLLGATPRSEALTVVGIFKTGKGVGLDNTLSYMHLKDLQTLYQKDNIITGLRIRTDDLYRAPELSEKLATQIPHYYMTTDWTAQYGNLIHAIALEKTMTLWILLLLVAIAAFNLVSSLVMLVNEKKAEIAILRTIGMRARSILSIFMIQGSLIGMTGTLLGLGCGFILSQHISALADLAETWFNFQLFAGNVFIQTLPSKINKLDFIHVGLAAFGMSIFATIYPAWRAAQTRPLEALRYE